MRRKKLIGPALCAAFAATAVLWPADAHAQRRGPRVRAVRPVVVVSRPYYRPYYRPYFSGYFWQGYPYPYPYPYPYGYRWDDRSELRIQATPRETQVYVDGYFVGVVDDFDGFAQRLRVEPGEHDIELYLDGHRVRRERMLFRPGASYNIRHVMEPVAAGEPPDPRPMPSATAAPQPRSYPRDPRDPRGGATRPGDPGAAAADTMGTLSIRVQPAGATVLIDGERWEWPEGESRLVVDIPEGTHRIEVQREGHAPQSTTVVVRRGQTATVNISLPRL